jgi:hypothetical protein
VRTVDDDEEWTIARLRELLDARDARIGELESLLEEAEGKLEGARSGWSLPRDQPPRDLPSPRLEVEWYAIHEAPDGTDDWRSFNVEYRLVMTHLIGHEVVIPLGLTRVDGGINEPPWSPRRTGRADGSPELPFRDCAHACHDAVFFGWPLYAILPSGPVPIDPWERHGPAATAAEKHRGQR